MRLVGWPASSSHRSDYVILRDTAPVQTLPSTPNAHVCGIPLDTFFHGAATVHGPVVTGDAVLRISHQECGQFGFRYRRRSFAKCGIDGLPCTAEFQFNGVSLGYFTS